MNSQLQFKKHDIVVSIVNPGAGKFRILQCGPKRAKVLSIESPSYFSCYAPVRVLRSAS